MKKELKKLFTERLKGFTKHIRHVSKSSDYGSVNEEGFFIPDDEIEIENWTSDELINYLLDINEREISSYTDKINKLFN